LTCFDAGAVDVLLTVLSNVHLLLCTLHTAVSYFRTVVELLDNV